MFGALRVAVVAASSVVLGSWIGLGKPSSTDGRAWLHRAKSELDARWESTASGANANARPTVDPARRKAVEEPVVRTPLPQEIEPESAPSFQPWPRLNPTVDVHRAWMIAQGPQRSAEDGRRLVTFTFDDGPFLETTPTVLKLLARYDVRATFFAVGQYLEQDDARSRVTRRLLRRISDEGHLVGNHTLDHTLLTAISHTRVLDQIDRSAAAIQRATGKYPYLFRPPYGQIDEFGQKAAQERHLEMVLWSVEAADMTRDDTAQMYSELVSQLSSKGGGIVLLHDIRPTSIVVLKDLLKWLHERRFDPKTPSVVGYEIVDLPTYLRAVEAAPLPYASPRDLEDDRKVARAFRASMVPSRTAKVERAARKVMHDASPKATEPTGERRAIASKAKRPAHRSLVGRVE